MVSVADVHRRFAFVVTNPADVEQTPVAGVDVVAGLDDVLHG